MEPLNARPAMVSGAPRRHGEKYLLTGEPDRVFMGHFLKETFVMERLKLRNFGFWFSYYYFYGQVCPSLRRT
jgi:hypothetical protein